MHSQGPRGRPTGGPIPWKTEHQAAAQSDESSMRGLPPVGSMYSTQQPMHRTVIREPMGGPGLMPGKAPLLNADASTADTWDKLMTFRTFVIDRVRRDLLNGGGGNLGMLAEQSIIYKYVWVLFVQKMFFCSVNRAIGSLFGSPFLSHISLLFLQVSEESESELAVVAYKQYKENFRKAYMGKLFRQMKVDDCSLSLSCCCNVCLPSAHICRICPSLLRGTTPSCR